MASRFHQLIQRICPDRVKPVLPRSLASNAVIAALLVASLMFPLIVSADGKRANKHWVGTWSTSPVVVGDVFDDQTLRQIVRISVGGDKVRVRFSNRFGEVPLVIDAASIGIQDTGATIVPGSLRELTFGGEPSIAVAAGAKVLSDPVKLAVPDEADLAISLYVATETGGSTMHTSAWQTSYIATGDFTGDEVMPETGETTSWHWLTGVDVWVHRKTFAVATAGDSITEGCCRPDFVNANVRYPDQLARLLLDRYRGKRQVAVLNAGISGNRVLNDIFGPNVQARLDPDVLTQSGVTHVILLEGVNDLGIGTALFGPIVESDEIIAGYKQIIKRVQAAGMKIFVGTILPFRGFEDVLLGYWTEENEEKRQMINAWIRTTELHDGFVDFDQAIRDPANPEFMLPIYDGGDGLHPSAEGYARMALEAENALFPRRKGGDDDDDDDDNDEEDDD